MVANVSDTMVDRRNRRRSSAPCPEYHCLLYSGCTPNRMS